MKIGINYATDELKNNISKIVLTAVKDGLPWINAQIAVQKVLENVTKDANNAVSTEKIIYQQQLKKEQEETKKERTEKAGE